MRSGNDHRRVSRSSLGFRLTGETPEVDRRRNPRPGATRSIAIRLMLGFLVIIVLTSAIFSVVGIRIIRNRVVAEAENKVQTDLNAAREIYQAALVNVFDVVRFSADRFYLRDALRTGNLERVMSELVTVQTREGLDFLTLTDHEGIVLFRAANPSRAGDSQTHDALVSAVLEGREPLAATSVLAAEELDDECPPLVAEASCELVPTPGARPRGDSVKTAGMVLKAAAPILAADGDLIGTLYGGVLLDSRFDLVDKIKQTVFRDARYKGTDIGAATIFQDDVRISTTVTGSDGSRAIGTRVTQPVYEQVVGAGVPWVGHSDAVDHTYISVYEPIRNINDSIVGMLAVGLLEDPYADLQARTSLLFLGITLAGALLAITLSYFIARRVAGPVRQLVGASRELARGNLDVTVSEQSVGELAELAHAFNSMSSALHARDEKLKEFTKKKIMESERLAVIGQLAADVAHELNNPLQGIVTYAHLLMESPTSSTSKASVEKIANQANRCTKIIRGLLDFSRPRAPQKKLANINALLDESLSLVENQALFHNIDIVKEWDASIPEIVVDPSQIQQVCMNLIFNAAEAMNGSGRLHISTSINGHGMIEVAFTDSGHGIAPDNLERVFDPFFTTKEVGHGTGLGLAISYGIVREHDGTITVESRVGEGTTFTVRIPARTEEDV